MSLDGKHDAEAAAAAAGAGVEEAVVKPDEVLREIVLSDDGEEKGDAAVAAPEEVPEALAEALEALKIDDSVQGFFEHTDPVYCVAVRPTCGRAVLCGSGDEDAYVWDSRTGAKLKGLEGHGESVTSAAWSHDGALMATGALNGEVRVFGYEPWLGRTHLLETQAEAVEWLSFHPRGPVLAAGLDDGTVYMWNAQSGATMQVFGGHLGAVMCGTFSADGKVLLSGGADGSVFVWDPKTGRPQHHFQGLEFHDAPVLALAAHPDPAQPLMLSGSEDCTARLSHTANGRVLWTLKEHTGAVEGVGFCGQQPWCATGSIDGRAIVWDSRTGQQRSVFRHDEAVTQIQWHPDTPLLYTASMDKTVRLWDARSSEAVRCWKGHQEGVLAVALAERGTRVVTGSDDGNCLVFDVAGAKGKTK